MMSVKHPNVLRFLGYCFDTLGRILKFERKLVMAERRERLLCFEYVSNGSLEQHLTGTMIHWVPLFLALIFPLIFFYVSS
jgi:coatomer subunit beta'